MTQDEIDNEYLYQQYVLTLKNDGKWYQRTREAVAEKNYARYIEFSWPFINAIMTKNRDSSSAHIDPRHRSIPLMMRRVAMMLWYEETELDHSQLKPSAALQAHIRSVRDRGIAPLILPGSQFYDANKFRQVHDETQYSINPAPTKEEIMAQTPAFETKNFVFGQDVKDMNTAELISAVQKVEASIEKLKQVKTASTKIRDLITEQEEFLAKIVEHLDAT
jgi:hypothetical protein